MREPQPFGSTRQMVELAARGLGRIDRDGVRGATRVSVEEIAAMAALLALTGVVPVPPGEPFPDTLIIPPQKEA
jgi:hypothetical protein